MKSYLGIALALIAATLGTNSSALTGLDLIDVNNVAVKAEVTVQIGDQAPVRLAAAKIDPTNRATVLFFADASESRLVKGALFHNSTEADWFMQFLKQASPLVKMNLALATGEILVDNYKVALTSFGDPKAVSEVFYLFIRNEAATDKDGKPADKPNKKPIIFDCGSQNNLVAGVTIGLTANAAPKSKADTLDGFTDLFRHSLEEQGYWIGKEGRLHRLLKTGRRSCQN